MVESLFWQCLALLVLTVAVEHTCGYGDKTSFSAECRGVCDQLKSTFGVNTLARMPIIFSWRQPREHGESFREAEPKAHCVPGAVNLHSKRGI